MHAYMCLHVCVCTQYLINVANVKWISDVLILTHLTDEIPLEPSSTELLQTHNYCHSS